MPIDIKTALTNPASHWADLIHALNADVLPAVIRQMNEEMSIHQIAKLATELLPENERNLTDARTRIGVLLEYSLALYLDQYVTDLLGPGHRVGFVVAHKFPDLVTRDPDHRPVLRIEVKCIQWAAEEKSANLDALLRDIKPHHDLLCVLVWEWKDAKRGMSLIDYPHVYRGFVFDAYVIAKVRDWGWLNEPRPGRSNDIDVATAVVEKDGSWKKEEKNLGKLMRIADPGALKQPPLDQFSDDSNVRAYLEFKQRVIELAISQGYQRIVKKAGYTLGTPQAWSYADSPCRVGTAADAHGKTLVIYFAPSLRLNKTKEAIVADLKSLGINACRVVLLGVKFSWVLADYAEEVLTSMATGKKPGKLIQALS